MSNLGTAAWLLALAPLLLIIGLRLSGVDQRSLPAVRLASFGLLLLLPSAGLWALVELLASAGVDGFTLSGTMRVSLAGIALVVAALMSPPHLRRRPTAHPVSHSVSFATLNVEFETPAAESLGRDLLDLDGDVVLVQEYTPQTRDAFHRSGLPAAYEFAHEDARDGYFGSAVFSRSPIIATEIREVGERPLLVTRLAIASTTITLANVHLQAPIQPADIVRWRTAFDGLAEIADEARERGEPMLMIGDWNATLAHRPMQRLLAGPLYDAHRTARRRWPRTWPVGRRVPTILCLDHVVHGPEIAVRSIEEHTFSGTDHRAVRAFLELP